MSGAGKYGQGVRLLVNVLSRTSISVIAVNVENALHRRIVSQSGAHSDDVNLYYNFVSAASWWNTIHIVITIVSND